MAGERKRTTKPDVSRAVVEKALKDARQRIQKLDLELTRIVETLQTAPICQHLYMPWLGRSKKLIRSKKAKRSR